VINCSVVGGPVDPISWCLLLYFYILFAVFDQ